jgi:hypothetical protein
LFFFLFFRQIRSSSFCKAEVNVWTDIERNGVIRFLQNDCGLSQRQLPAAVRAVEKSKLKTEVQVLFMQQVKAAIYGGTHAKSMNAGSGGNRDRSNSSSKADPSAKVTSADRDAACFAVGAKSLLVSFYFFFWSSHHFFDNLVILFYFLQFFLV